MIVGRPATCQCGECPKCQHKEYMREWYRSSRRAYSKPEVRRAYERARYREDAAYRLRHSARVKLAQARRRGLVLVTPCAICGDADVVGHHNDYANPMDGTWLCRACHDTIHGPLPTA